MTSFLLVEVHLLLPRFYKIIFAELKICFIFAALLRAVSSAGSEHPDITCREGRAKIENNAKKRAVSSAGSEHPDITCREGRAKIENNAKKGG